MSAQSTLKPEKIVRRASRRIQVAFFVLVCLCTIPSGPFGELWAQDELRLCKDSFERLNRIAWTARQQTKMTRIPDNTSISVDYYIEGAVLGSRWTCLSKQTGTVLAFGQPADYSLFQNVVGNGAQVIQMNSSDLDSQYRKRFAQAVEVPTPANPKSMVLIGSLDTSMPFQRGTRYGYFYAGRLIFGNLEENMTLYDLVSGGNLDPSHARPDLLRCIVVSAVGDYGEYVAWLDPDHGCLPARVEVRKSGGAKFASGVSIDESSRAQAGSIFPTSQLTSLHQVIADVSFASLDGMPLIQSFTDMTVNKYADGQECIVRTELKLQEIRSPVESDFELRVRPPEDTKVNVFKDPKIKYVWQDGKIVPDTTPATVKTLEGLSHKPQQGQLLKFLLIALNLFVVAFFAYWVMRRRSNAV